MIKKLLAKKINSISIAALMVASSSLLSRLLGVVRDHILAGQFGAGNELDVYYAAFRVPDLVFNLVVLGALSAGFIPVFTQLISEEQRQKEAWELVNNVLNILAVFMLVVVGILFVWAGPLIKLITPGFDSAKIAETVWLTRIMFLSPLLLGISSVVGGVLQSYKRFLVYSLSPIFYNLGIIFGIYCSKLHPNLGIKPLLWGVILGAFIHFLIQAIASIRAGFSWTPILKFTDPATKQVLKLFVPKIFGIDSSQVSLIITSFFGSFLAPGTIALYNLSSNIQAVPVGVFGVSLAVTSFPILSKFYAEKNEDLFFSTFSKTLIVILTILIPTSIVFAVYRFVIMNILFGSGKFTVLDVIETGRGLLFFALSIPFQGLIGVVARSFYARGSTLIPVIWSGVALIVNAFLAFMLGLNFGVSGLAIAFSISVIVQFFGLFVHFLLYSRNQITKESRNIAETVKYIAKHVFFLCISAVVFGVLLTYLKPLGQHFLPNSNKIAQAFNMLVSSAVSGGILLWLLMIFKNPIISELKQSLNKLIKSA
jgi:putative peptidoglycan lipid II flippase